MHHCYQNDIGHDSYVSLDLMLAKVQITLNIDVTAISLRTNTNKYFYLERRGYRGRWIQDPDARCFFERLEPIITKGQIFGESNLFKKIPCGTNLQHEENFRAYYVVPVNLRDNAMGILEVFNHTPIPASLEWITKLTSLADELAAVITNSTAASSLQGASSNQSRNQSIMDGLLQVLSMRDIETEMHSRRTAEMTVQLAKEMGISGGELDHYERGALLHDIGKIAIPDEILLKPAPLTETEWIVMRKHPVFAYELLSGIPFKDQALDIPHYHHEKWDGSGYPDSLQGEEIPLSARVFAVVDVWDSLCTEKPFRPAWSKTKTEEYILSQSDKHFDPEVVKVFLSII